jgi:hypothetical protein
VKNSKPPAVATWLLNHFGPDPSGPGNDEAFVGDLMEHFQEGRSRLWYWRQVAVAIARPESRFVMTTVRVLIIGWLMEIYVVPLLVGIILPYPPISASRILTSVLIAGLITGGLLALLNRPNPLSPMLVFVASYFGKDLYRLLVWPGIQMTPSYGTPRIYVVTWLLGTGMDAVFAAGVLAAGILLAYRPLVKSAKAYTRS